MAKAILYYSRSGTTKAYAERLAADSGAELVEVCEPKKRNFCSALLFGCPKGFKYKGTEILPLTVDLSAYDELVLMAPVWAGCPAPAINSVIFMLPEGQTVSLVCTAGKGGVDLSKTVEMIKARGCTIKEVHCVGAVELAAYKSAE